VKQQILVANPRTVVMQIVRSLTEEIDAVVVISCKVILIRQHPLQPVGIIKFFIRTFYHYTLIDSQFANQLC
jgi:hypothetical protein